MFQERALKSYIRDDFWKWFNELPPYAKKQANKAFEYFVLRVVHTPYFHIEYINIDKWTDEKIKACLMWIREKLQ